MAEHLAEQGTIMRSYQAHKQRQGARMGNAASPSAADSTVVPQTSDDQPESSSA